MTGTIQTKRHSSGKEFYYIKLKYQEPITKKWKDKWIATGLLVKSGNKRKVNAQIAETVEKYSYLEQKTEVDKDILLPEYIDYWLKSKKTLLRPSTYEAYVYRTQAIKKYFNGKKVTKITPRMISEFYQYSLLYGKRNQKTGEREPLSVRTVRSYGSILYAIFVQAMIDNLISVNPTVGIHDLVRKIKNSLENISL